MEKNQKNIYKWKRLLNYGSIVKQLPFFLFLSGLAILYIYNGHNADKTIRKISRSTSQLKDLQAEYKGVTGDVLLRTRQSEMVETVKPLALKELTEEAIVLTDSVGE